MSRISLSSASTSISRSEPNLMPFHIDYNGTAPISTFLHVQDAKRNVGAPELEPDMSLNDANHDSQITEVGNQDLTGSNASTSTLVSSSSKDSSLSGPSLDDLPSRFVSTFRGRTIHGLEVEVPQGYQGVVFKSEGVTAAQKQKNVEMKEKEKLKAAAAKRRAKMKKQKEETGTDSPSRRTRSSSRKAVVDVDDDVDMNDSDSGENNEESTEQDADGSASLNLAPVSRFSSFVLWHPDIPVDSGKDEYLGTLSEWMKVAQLVQFFSTEVFKNASL